MTENKNISGRWVDLVEQLALDPIPDRMISSGIKYFNDKEFCISGEEWNAGWDVPLEMLGYGKNSTKMKQLRRNYYNSESIKAARDKLEERLNKKSDYTSVMATMVGDDKDPRSQGHCMSSTIVTYNPRDFVTGEPQLTVDIFYRVTEVIRKFGADLKFLSEEVVPAMLPDELEPEDIWRVKFHFGNIYFSPLFLPIMIPQMDVLELMRNIEGTQPIEALRGCYHALWTLNVEDLTHYSYRSRRNMHEFITEAVGEDKPEYIQLMRELSARNSKLRKVPE